MTLQDLIKDNSRKPMVELLKEASYLKFDDEKYASRYCEAHCPHRFADYHWECPGGCRTWDYGMKEGTCTVYGAEMLIGTVLREGYQALRVKNINEPFRKWSDTDYVYCEDTDSEICEGCEYCGKPECPEDILSGECPRSGNAWAVEHITEAVNDVLKYSL